MKPKLFKGKKNFFLILFSLFIFLIFNFNLISADFVYNNIPSTAVTVISSTTSGNLTDTNDSAYIAANEGSWSAAASDTNDSAYIASQLNNWLSTYNATYASNLDTNDSAYIASKLNDWQSTYNATYASNQANNSFNQTTAENLFILQSDEPTLNVNSSYWFANAEGFGDGHFEIVENLVAIKDNVFTGIEWAYNQTLATYNQWGGFWYNHTADVDTLYGNDYRSTYNATYASNIDTNDSVYIASKLNDWQSTYNATYAANLDTNDSVYIASKNNDWSSTYNSTYDAKISFDTTNLAYQNESNIFTANQNISANNITTTDCIFFLSGGKICSGT